MLNTEEYILKAYSNGHLGWREVCRRLDLNDFAELENILKRYEIPDYVPKSDEYISNINRIDGFLYDDWDE